MTTDKIIAAAREAGYFLYDLTETHGIKTVESDEADQWAQLSRFYAIAYQAGMERAAEIATIHSQYPIEGDFDRGYSKGSQDASDRIRAHAKNQPESTHDTGNV